MYMKRAIVIVLSSITIASQAALIPLGISPPGTDAAVGLSPSNEVPAVTGTGSGDVVSGGILFDTDSNTLMLTIGYGSAAGFTDLTGPATSMTLNGPAGTNQTAPVLADLSSFSFPAANPAMGGIIFGTITISSNAVADLLAGSNYVNIGTATNSSGEIRGQLVVLMPSITCPDPVTVECGTQADLTVQVGSQAGNAMTVVWSLEGMALATNQIPAGPPPTSANANFASELPLGTNVIDVVVTDSAGLSASCSTVVTVVDTNAPVITNATASPKQLWPPNNKFVVVTIHASVLDTCDATSWKIIGVQSSETNSTGSPQYIITGPHTVKLLAQRNGTGSGRIYTITIQAVDASGNLSSPTDVIVTVPHDQGKGNGQGGGGNNGNQQGNGKALGKK
jgi:hypothetical protein